MRDFEFEHHGTMAIELFRDHWNLAYQAHGLGGRLDGLSLVRGFVFDVQKGKLASPVDADYDVAIAEMLAASDFAVRISFIDSRSFVAIDDQAARVEHLLQGIGGRAFLSRLHMVMHNDDNCRGISLLALSFERETDLTVALLKMKSGDIVSHKGVTEFRDVDGSWEAIEQDETHEEPGYRHWPAYTVQDPDMPFELKPRCSFSMGDLRAPYGYDPTIGYWGMHNEERLADYLFRPLHAVREGWRRD